MVEISLGVAILALAVTVIFALILNSENKMLHDELAGARYTATIDKQGWHWAEFAVRKDLNRVKAERDELRAILAARQMTEQPATRPEDV